MADRLDALAKKLVWPDASDFPGVLALAEDPRGLAVVEELGRRFDYRLDAADAKDLLLLATGPIPDPPRPEWVARDRVPLARPGLLRSARPAEAFAAPRDLWFMELAREARPDLAALPLDALRRHVRGRVLPLPVRYRVGAPYTEDAGDLSGFLRPHLIKADLLLDALENAETVRRIGEWIAADRAASDAERGGYVRIAAGGRLSFELAPPAGGESRTTGSICPRPRRTRWRSSTSTPPTRTTRTSRGRAPGGRAPTSSGPREGGSTVSYSRACPGAGSTPTTTPLSATSSTSESGHPSPNEPPKPDFPSGSSLTGDYEALISSTSGRDFCFLWEDFLMRRCLAIGLAILILALGARGVAAQDDGQSVSDRLLEILKQRQIISGDEYSELKGLASKMEDDNADLSRRLGELDRSIADYLAKGEDDEYNRAHVAYRKGSGFQFATADGMFELNLGGFFLFSYTGWDMGRKNGSGYRYAGVKFLGQRQRRRQPEARPERLPLRRRHEQLRRRGDPVPLLRQRVREGAHVLRRIRRGR